MITQAFRHFRGLGPSRLAQLETCGIRNWDHLIQTASDNELPFSDKLSKQAVADANASANAVANKDIPWLVNAFHGADHWRILAQWFEHASFFDIETDGTHADARVTCISIWHKGQLLWFVDDNGEIDDFLDLLEDVDLLVSFNGASFDVPRIMDAYRIPELPCPHVDLRWICHHQGVTGGLKSISERLQCNRPADLDGADGALAVELWHQWNLKGNQGARDLLVRYCAADVVLTRLVAANLIKQCGAELAPDASDPWLQLPPSPADAANLLAQFSSITPAAPHDFDYTPRQEKQRPKTPRFFLRRKRTF